MTFQCGHCAVHKQRQKLLWLKNIQQLKRAAVTNHLLCTSQPQCSQLHSSLVSLLARRSKTRANCCRSTSKTFDQRLHRSLWRFHFWQTNAITRTHARSHKRHPEQPSHWPGQAPCVQLMCIRRNLGLLFWPRQRHSNSKIKKEPQDSKIAKQGSAAPLTSTTKLPAAELCKTTRKRRNPRTKQGVKIYLVPLANIGRSSASCNVKQGAVLLSSVSAKHMMLDILSILWCFGGFEAHKCPFTFNFFSLVWDAQCLAPHL